MEPSPPVSAVTRRGRCAGLPNAAIQEIKALEVIAQHTRADGSITVPMRVAHTRVDLGIAAAWRGDLDGVVSRARRTSSSAATCLAVGPGFFFVTGSSVSVVTAPFLLKPGSAADTENALNYTDPITGKGRSCDPG